MKNLTTQTFNNNKLTRTKVTNNIIRCYNKTSIADRHDWYQDANDFASEISTSYSISLDQAAGIISALSPMKSWDQNKTLAKQFLEGRRSGTFGANIKKSELILQSGTNLTIPDILKGKKTVSFYKNIRDVKNNSDVTVDRHAIEIAVNMALGERLKAINSSQYEFFKACYIRAAKKLNLRPSMLQSATWVYWRVYRKSLPVTRA